MFLRHNNMIIRNAEKKDVELLAKWWNDGNIMAHAGFPNGLGTTPKVVLEQISKDSDERHRRMIIELDNIPIGEMNYNNMGNRIAEIGIKICDFSKQERGYGRQILSMLINSLFNDFGYKKIILDTNLRNKRAQHVYEKLGFRKIRTNIDSWKDQNGFFQSSIDYELIEEDFINFAL